MESVFEPHRTLSMQDVLSVLASLTSLILRQDSDEDHARDQITRQISAILEQTDTPFLDDTTFDPFMKSILPALVDQAIQACRTSTQRRMPRWFRFCCC